MDIKQKAYQLKQSGLSFNEVGKKLGVSKTTAFDYVKEYRLTIYKPLTNAVLNGSEPEKNVRSEQSERKESNRSEPLDIPKLKQNIVSTLAQIELKSDIPKEIIKEFTGDDLIKKKFESLDFQGKFFELIGKPAKHFSGIIWGLPKGGKSNLSIRLADYLQEYFGSVLYIAAEEGESVTLQEKFKEIGGSKVTILETRNKESIRQYLSEKNFEFVFIDSINNAGIDNDFLQLLKNENCQKSFVAIVQATKGGNFKGDQALTHNCDFIVKVIDGIAHHTGRFQITSQINIFEEPLYKKNEAQKLHKPVKISKQQLLASLNAITSEPSAFIKKPIVQKKNEVSKATEPNNNQLMNMFLLFVGTNLLSKFFKDDNK